MGRIIRVDMDSSEISREETPSEYELLGGRGLIGAILTKEVRGSCHALGKQNRLIFAPGLLGGTYLPCSGKMSIGAKSPMTGGFKEANCGGALAFKLAKLKIKAVIIQGKPKGDEAYILEVDTSGARLKQADNLKKACNYQLIEELHQRYGKKVSIASVGIAGSNGLINSTVAVTDLDGNPTRHAARGGMGAVMGAKGIKAIVVNDEGASRVKPHAPEAYKKLQKQFAEQIRNDPALKSRSKYGTLEMIDVANEMGFLPTKNFSAGRFEEARNFNGETIYKIRKERGGKMHACMPACPIRCSVTYPAKDGKHLTSALEYETVAMLGANLGISDPDALALLDRTCDDIGVDTIEMGVTLGLMTEVGIMRFGDHGRALELIEEIRKESFLGRIIGSGALVASKVFGINRVPTIKGQAIPAYDPRVSETLAITMVTSPLGADHTAGWGVTGETYEENIQSSKVQQALFALVDSLGLCLFSKAMEKQNLVLIAGLINSLFGLTTTPAQLLELGEAIINNEKRFNAEAGLSQYDNNVPDFFRAEPLPPNKTVFDVPAEYLRKI